MDHTAPAPRTDTRSRAQEVALELFAEQGYEKTSLREIAERLGVTKAALYYHFKSKDEIIQSLIEDQTSALLELVAWGREQPRGVETRRELVRRYAASLSDRPLSKIMKFFERNQTALQKSEATSSMRHCMMELIDLFVEPDSPVAVQLRRSMAVFALHSMWFTLRDPNLTDD